MRNVEPLRLKTPSYVTHCHVRDVADDSRALSRVLDHPCPPPVQVQQRQQQQEEEEVGCRLCLLRLVVTMDLFHPVSRQVSVTLVAVTAMVMPRPHHHHHHRLIPVHILSIFHSTPPPKPCGSTPVPLCSFLTARAHLR